MKSKPPPAPLVAVKLAQLDQITAIIQSQMMEMHEHLNQIRELTESLRENAASLPPTSLIAEQDRERA